MTDPTDLIKRLRGEHHTPVTDGHGPAGGEEPDTPPIQKEAATVIEEMFRTLESAEHVMKLLIAFHEEHFFWPTVRTVRRVLGRPE